jgi:hypothetical protein
MDEKEYVNFKEQFWKWFDSLPTSEKAKFWFYQEDMAETFFFFRHYK